jgi:hypothetical protein
MASPHVRAGNLASKKPADFRRETVSDVLPYCGSSPTPRRLSWREDVRETAFDDGLGGSTRADGKCSRSEELTGIIGRTFVSDQGVLNSNLFDNNLHFGEGLTFEVNYGRHLMGNGFARLAFEVPAVFDPKQKVHFASGVEPASYSTYFVTPSLRANAFAGTAVSPWISIGGGFGHFGVADHLEFGGSNPGKARIPESFKWVGLGRKGYPYAQCAWPSARFLVGKARPQPRH